MNETAERAPAVTLFVVTIEKIPRGVVWPMLPENTILASPDWRVRLCAPLTVLEKEILPPAGVPPPLVESIEIAAVRATGPVIPMLPPIVVRLPLRLIDVAPV